MDPRSKQILMRTLAAGAALALMLTVFTVDRAAAGAPTDQLRGSVDSVLRTLTDPELKKGAKSAERRRSIRLAANEIFDFPEISRRSLAVHWQARSPAERQQFVGLFGDLLEHSYISKIESYSGEKIQYVGETIDGNQAVVRTRIVSKQGTETPVVNQSGSGDTKSATVTIRVPNDRFNAALNQIKAIDGVDLQSAQVTGEDKTEQFIDLDARLKAKQDERPGSREVGRGDEIAAPMASPAQPARQSP